jgi:hypothetical protein
MSQVALIALLTELDVEEFLACVQTQDHPQEDETLQRCEVWLDECTTWVS